MISRKIGQFFHDRFRSNEASIHELTYLFWECTLRCNLNCLHCGSDCIADSRQPDMPFEDFLAAILPIREYYPPDSITVVITGGEPLLRKDLPEYGKALRENGFRWSIVTNGFCYTPELHYRLLSCGMGAITVSLDGLEESHNRLRRHPLSFRNAVQVIDLITASHRLNHDVVTCVHPGNIQELPELMEILISLKVKAWRLFTIAPIGRAAGEAMLQLSSLQLKTLMDFIVQSRKQNCIQVTFSCEAYTGTFEKKVRDSWFFCRAGINIASVLIDGSISACPNINRHFVQGNIYKDRFIDVWENRFQIMRNRTWTKKGICAECREYSHCNGGAMHLWDEKQEGIRRCIHAEMNKPI
jgi:radical SAM enzyme (rSAM/lipoprotein system)